MCQSYEEISYTSRLSCFAIAHAVQLSWVIFPGGYNNINNILIILLFTFYIFSKIAQVIM